MKNKRWPLLDARAISNLLVALIAISFYLAASHIDLVRQHIAGVANVVSPFIMGFAIAYLLNAPMRFFETKVFYKLKHKHGLSIGTVYLLALLVVTVLLNMVLPQVVQSARVFVYNVPMYLRNLNDLSQTVVDYFHIDNESLKSLVVTYNDLVRQVSNVLYTKLPDLLNLGFALGSGVVSGVTALISSIYMLAGKRKLIPQMKRLIYAFVPTQRANVFLEYCRRANRIFASFINGKLIDSAIIGVLCFLFARLLKIPFAILVSVIVGITNIIPFFGPIIGAVPCLMILIIVQPWSALRFGLLIIVLQQFDGNILGPKILGDSTGLSAILVLLAIVVGGGLFGFVGMILGVPTFAVLYSILRDVTAEKLRKRGIREDGTPAQIPRCDEE